MRALALACLLVVGCADEVTGKDPETADRAPIDRFSAAAGTLLVRDLRPGLPGPDAPVDFDQPPFLVRGLGPDGRAVGWYDWDVRPRAPAPIWAFVDGDGNAVDDQLNVVDVIPGDPGYNDLWQVVLVTVPDDYVANTITSREELEAAGYRQTTTAMLVNCPVVPRASVARRRLPGDYSDLHKGWYRGQRIQYFHFGEARLALDGGQVPVGAMYAAFAINPGDPGGGPASGWKLGADGRSHAVIDSLPGEAGYSSWREVHVYDVAAFASVTDLASARAATPVMSDAWIVNAPVVELAPAP